MRIPQPTRPLHQTLLALSMVHFGRANNDVGLVKQGQQTYGHALRLLQGALYDLDRIQHDETLAAVRAMALYEVRLSSPRP
jgi:hypothetical protein